MKPIPTEMRKRILDDCDDGMTEIEAAEKWNVSPSFITKLKRRIRETGSLEPTKPKLAPHYELLRQIVEQTPDATIEEIRDQLPVTVAIATVFNELRKLKLVYKKTTPRRRTGSGRRRAKTTGVESDATRFESGKSGVSG